jgi:hypothetical protein
MTTEILFMVEESVEGGFVARTAGEAIFTEADSLSELRTHFESDAIPQLIRLHFVRDEVIAA